MGLNEEEYKEWIKTKGARESIEKIHVKKIVKNTEKNAK